MLYDLTLASLPKRPRQAAISEVLYRHLPAATASLDPTCHCGVVGLTRGLGLRIR
jgi:hypothetical protein